MKVLQINAVCGTGSTGRISTDIYKVLEQKGHECLIAYGRGSAVENINSIKIGTKFDNYIHVAKTRLFDRHGYGSLKATKEFIERVKEYNPDVIHLHNIHGYYVNIMLLFNYLKESNKPVVWTLHDCWAFTGHCSHFDYVKCEKWKTRCNNCPQKKRYPKSLFKDYSKHNFDRKKELFTGIRDMVIVTPSDWLSELVKQSFLKEYTIKVINNGIDLELFTPNIHTTFRSKYKIEEKFVILGVASIWDERKGLKYFIELSKNIDDNSIVVLCGLNDRELRQIPENIIGITRTNSVERLAEIYSEADVFINPTLEDNFPTTNIEALACGTPIITFDTGGCREIIDETCGILVEKGSIKGLIKAINEIREEKYDRKGCIERAIRFDKKERFNDYVKIYNQLI